jgi:hypothetical protein
MNKKGRAAMADPVCNEEQIWSVCFRWLVLIYYFVEIAGVPSNPGFQAVAFILLFVSRVALSTEFLHVLFRACTTFMLRFINTSPVAASSNDQTKQISIISPRLIGVSLIF